MNVLAVVGGLAGLGILAALVRRPALVGLATAGIGVAGVVTGVAALRGRTFDADLPALLPLAGVEVAVDPLGGWFLAITGAVVAVSAMYGIGYAGHGPGQDAGKSNGRGVLAALPVFATSMLLVPAAASASTLLVLWELMALASLVLVLAEHRQRPAVAEAGGWYAALTHVGFVAILLAGAPVQPHR